MLYCSFTLQFDILMLIFKIKMLNYFYELSIIINTLRDNLFISFIYFSLNIKPIFYKTFFQSFQFILFFSHTYIHLYDSLTSLIFILEFFFRNNKYTQNTTVPSFKSQKFFFKHEKKNLTSDFPV